MKQYTCPMHPEIEQAVPGKCPKCGMALVVKGGSSSTHHEVMEKNSWKSYLPLLVIIAIILSATLALTVRDMQFGTFTVAGTLSYFMIGFFLTFAGFKLMDLKGFAEGYATYDLLAQKWFGYGYVYPFIELFFGLSMILMPEARWLLWTELIVMAFSGIGVAIKIAKKEKFQCSCLGTFLKVPLTKVTLIEDFGMALLVLLMLII